MNDPTNSPAPLPTPSAKELAGIVPVDDLDQFVRTLSVWHSSKVAMVQHLLSVPPGTEFSVGEGADETTVKLTGDTLTGFKFGLEMALMQLGTLPFAVEFEDAPDAPKEGA